MSVLALLCCHDFEPPCVAGNTIALKSDYHSAPNSSANLFSLCTCLLSFGETRSGCYSDDMQMAGSSDDEGLDAGNSKKADDFRKFAFAHRTDSDKSGSKKAGTSKPSLRAQLSEALSNGKSKVRHGDQVLLSGCAR